MIAAITYIGKRNDKLGLYPFKRFTSTDAIPAQIKTLISDSPAFASQFLDADKFKALMQARHAAGAPPKVRKSLPARRVPQASPIRKR
jgi:hypothetical protein